MRRRCARRAPGRRVDHEPRCRPRRVTCRHGPVQRGRQRRERRRPACRHARPAPRTATSGGRHRAARQQRRSQRHQHQPASPCYEPHGSSAASCPPPRTDPSRSAKSTIVFAAMRITAMGGAAAATRTWASTRGASAQREPSLTVSRQSGHSDEKAGESAGGRCFCSKDGRTNRGAATQAQPWLEIRRQLRRRRRGPAAGVVVHVTRRRAGTQRSSGGELFSLLAVPSHSSAIRLRSASVQLKDTGPILSLVRLRG